MVLCQNDDMGDNGYSIKIFVSIGGVLTLALIIGMIVTIVGVHDKEPVRYTVGMVILFVSLLLIITVCSIMGCYQTRCCHLCHNPPYDIPPVIIPSYEPQDHLPLYQT